MFGSGTKSDELVMSDRLRAHFEELTATVRSEHFRPDGIPKSITFDEIESLGQQLAQSVAEKFSRTATAGRQRHFHLSSLARSALQTAKPKTPWSVRY